MRTDTGVKLTRLEDYTPPPFLIGKTHLDFDLYPDATVVTADLYVTRNGVPGCDLVLDGEDLKLVEVMVDGALYPKSKFRLGPKSLTLMGLPDTCVVRTKSVCAPSQNTKLMGLYLSGERFCTQCEAEGFRRITWYLDRPDVLSRFSVRMSADKDAYPTLLANGNPTDRGVLDGGRHYASWEDPFPKPAYLFALVAGTFDMIDDHFTTMSGRDVKLEIYVDPGQANAAHWSMDCLKRSMKWDEETFGREYDLDLFMIVAVRDFNFGAMENKGLNIFNSAYILAEPETATDADYEAIESVVAHEYFHNWTGNRITCRDWFQLCLKEGLTVFRDQEFSADQRGRSLQRIKDVKRLRARQFPEDQGPLAHPVRPDAYAKIDNFYTATIYEKGAEIIRMLKTLIGPQKFREGMDIYFDRWDGHATTVEAFVQCFADVSDLDMDQWMRWYTQAGTPHIKASLTHDPDSRTAKLTFRQSTPPSPGQDKKSPLTMPVKYSLVSSGGDTLHQGQVDLSKASAAIELENISQTPVLSVLDGFSVPAVLSQKQSAKDQANIMAHGPDLFNRWEAGQTLMRDAAGKIITAIETGKIPRADMGFKSGLMAMISTLNDPDIDNGFKAIALSPPTFGDIIQSRTGADPSAIVIARKWLRGFISGYGKTDMLAAYDKMSAPEEFSAAPSAANDRSLKNVLLSLICSGHITDGEHRALTQFETANNMTDSLSALECLVAMGKPSAGAALSSFYEKWKDNPLVIDKWFALQARYASLSRIEALAAHADFDRNNPNRVRALLGNFAMGNPAAFHREDGQSYDWFVRFLTDIDRKNPALAARLLGVLEIKSRLKPELQALIDENLTRISKGGASKNVLEIAGKLQD